MCEGIVLAFGRVEFTGPDPQNRTIDKMWAYYVAFPIQLMASSLAGFKKKCIVFNISDLVSLSVKYRQKGNFVLIRLGNDSCCNLPQYLISVA